MHPAQLSLLADQVSTPAPMLLAELPEVDVAKAISLLGTLIAKASAKVPTEETTPATTVVSANE